MRIQAKLWRRLGDVTGLAGLIATLSLLSPGVEVVRADDAPLMSVDPALVAAAERAARSGSPPDPARPASIEASPEPAAPAAAVINPFVPVEEADKASRPGVSGIEIQPGVVVLNTRGYNYGPPPTPLTPEALAQESAPR